MVQRVRDIHGRFVHPDEKAAQDAAIAAKYAWQAPVVIREWEDGYKLARIVEYADLKLLGELQGHCAGAHWKWCGEQQIWHIVTLLDSRGEPHGYVHMKDTEWIRKPHPDDTGSNVGKYAMGGYNNDVYYHPGDLNLPHFKSTAYGEGYNQPAYSHDYYSPFRGHYNVSGHKTDILSVGAFSEAQRKYIDEWLSEARIEDEGTVAAARVA